MSEIYGHTIEPDPLEPGEIVTDVVAVARVVKHDDDGNITDYLKILSTDQCTPVVEVGMLTMAAKTVTHFAGGAD